MIRKLFSRKTAALPALCLAVGLAPAAMADNYIGDLVYCDVAGLFGSPKAVAAFTELGEHYKVEIIEELPEGEEISVYRQGEWMDLCRGPHVPSTGQRPAGAVSNRCGNHAACAGAFFYILSW